MSSMAFSSLARFSGSPIHTRPCTPLSFIACANGVQLASPAALYCVL